jgi:hypothetical protein
MVAGACRKDAPPAPVAVAARPIVAVPRPVLPDMTAEHIGVADADLDTDAELDNDSDSDSDAETNSDSDDTVTVDHDADDIPDEADRCPDAPEPGDADTDGCPEPAPP